MDLTYQKDFVVEKSLEISAMQIQGYRRESLKAISVSGVTVNGEVRVVLDVQERVKGLRETHWTTGCNPVRFKGAFGNSEWSKLM